jgi:hypothetical protein
VSTEHLYQSRVKVVQQGMASQGISTTTPHTHKKKTWRQRCQLARSWQLFWDSEWVSHFDFLPHGITTKAQYYSNLLHNEVHHVIQKNWETVKYHPTVWQRTSTYRKFEEGDIGNNGLGNHEPTPLEPWLSPQVIFNCLDHWRCT